MLSSCSRSRIDRPWKEKHGHGSVITERASPPYTDLGARSSVSTHTYSFELKGEVCFSFETKAYSVAHAGLRLII